MHSEVPRWVLPRSGKLLRGEDTAGVTHWLWPLHLLSSWPPGTPGAWSSTPISGAEQKSQRQERGAEGLGPAGIRQWPSEPCTACLWTPCCFEKISPLVYANHSLVSVPEANCGFPGHTRRRRARQACCRGADPGEGSSVSIRISSSQQQHPEAREFLKAHVLLFIILH